MRFGRLTVLLACLQAAALAADNAAAGRPYLLQPAPARNSDPAFASGRAWYRGELTDGVVATADARKAAWVQFPQSCGPICTIDLGREQRVVGVAVHALGGGPGNIAFPIAIRVDALAAALDVGQTIGWATFNFPHEKGKGRLSVKRLTASAKPTTTRFVRVEVNGRRNASLRVSEIEVLVEPAPGGALAEPEPLPRNVALGAQYTVSTPALPSNPDRGGKELTDGQYAGAFEKHGAWARWRGRVEVDVTLPREEKVARAGIGALGGNVWGIAFPRRIEVYALAGNVWLRLGAAAGGGVPKPLEGRFAVRRYAFEFAPIRASRFRFVVTGTYIFLDELTLGAAEDRQVAGVSPRGAMC